MAAIIGQSVTDYPEQITGLSENCLAVAPEDLSSCEIYILMDDDAELITRLISLGLNEKEAYFYLHLLKYGPKSISVIAESLKTYREDVYRMLTSLIDKGMVSASLESPTVYAAMDLDIALASALKKAQERTPSLRRGKIED